MDTKPRCQSCGMPLLGLPGSYGTNADGSENRNYCKFCWQNRAFGNPDMTLEDMIASSVKFMSENLHYSREEAERLSREIIPTLKRWR